MTTSDKNRYSSFNYESKIESLFFFKDLAVVFAKPAAIVYIILVLLFIFLEKGINKISFLLPLVIISPVLFIIISLLVMLFIWESLFSPYKIYVKDNHITCKFFYKKAFHTNIDDILYIKHHKGYSKTQGAYYKNKYTLTLKNNKKFIINCFIFKNSSDMNFLFTNITMLANKKYIKHIQTYSDIHHENEYSFYILKNTLTFLLTLCLLFLLVFFIFRGIFFPAIIVFAVLAAIPAFPVKIIMNINERTIILKSAFGIKILRISYDDIKQIIITNNFNISVNAVFNENRKKNRTFSLSCYRSKDRDKIFKILHIVFKNKVSFDLNGDEPLISDKMN